MISKVTTTIYTADDKSKWTTEEECIKRDKDVADVAEVMALITARPKEPFAGYIQHTPEGLWTVFNGLFELVKKDESLYKSLERTLVSEGLNESEYAISKSLMAYMMYYELETPLGQAYGRLSRINMEGGLKEWSHCIGKFDRKDICINNNIGD